MPYKVVSTFSGVGGSSLGYKMAGLEVVAAVEFLDYQANTYRENHPGTKLFEGDIRELDPLAVLDSVGLKPGELDVLDGSPPCSSFSMAGARESKWGESKPYGNKTQRTDDLFFEFSRFVEAMKPKTFVAENVKGLTAGIAKGYLQSIIQELRSHGYRVKAKVLNSANYGVPQRRERLIIVGVRNDIPHEYEYPTPFETLFDLRDEFAKINTPENVAEAESSTCDFIKPYLPQMLPGESAGKYHPKGSYFTHSRIGVTYSPTITATRQQYHFSENRMLTVPEAKFLTGFPDSFRLLGPPDRQWEACGRTVPPPMMKAVAKSLITSVL